MTPDILQPLENDASIWIWQHELTQTTGLTFAMSFLGTSKKIWKKMIWFSGQSLDSMVNHYKNSINVTEEDKNNWSWDQTILTYSILENQLCNINPENRLWKKFLMAPLTFNDSQTCW